VRRQRKALKVSAGAAAAAAGMSRQTLNRIERGEPSVTMGAYVNALQALGLQLEARGVPVAPEPATAPRPKSGVKVDSVRVSDYPQLQLLAWHLSGAKGDLSVPGAQALALYERNWRHLEQATLIQRERDLIEALVKAHGNGVLLV
jgi:transcriptional regulator with XRE-family HTH domain